MPNWTEQELHVVGRKSDVDRFIRTGFSRSHRGESDDLLDFDALCPSRRPQPDVPDTGVVLTHYRTRTQACFRFITAWDYPAGFYERLGTHWPTLAFGGTVNGEMGDFGGVLTYHTGEFVNLVRDYGYDYDRRAHGREIRRLLKRWGTFLTDGREWRAQPNAPWDNGSMPINAHFDGDFWFYFLSRDDMARFQSTYRCTYPQRRVNGTWQRTRVSRPAVSAVHDA